MRESMLYALGMTNDLIRWLEILSVRLETWVGAVESIPPHNPPK